MLTYIAAGLLGVIIILFVTFKYAHNKYIGTPAYCKSKASMKGKVFVITGANSGIGKETALDMAKRGARVICASRNSKLGEDAVREIQTACGHSNIIYKSLDLADFDSVRKFAQWVIDHEDKVDVLINNAGLSRYKKKSKYGYDLTFTVNHLGPFLLTYLLLDLMRKAAPSRIVNISSVVHRWTKSPMNFTPGDEEQYPKLRNYDYSKLANILHARHLTNILKGSGVTANSLHPGAVSTNIWSSLDDAPWPRWAIKLVQKFITWIMWTPEEGAQTTIYCAVSEDLETVSGRYFVNCQLANETEEARSDEIAKRLWDVSMKMCGIIEK